jgi:ribosomal protein L35
MRNKDKNTKLRLSGSTLVSTADEARVKRMLTQ